MLGDVERSCPRALADNPEGSALVGQAIREAIRLGLDTCCGLAKRSVSELDFGRADAWERWQAERDRTPEARAWPAELEAITPATVEDASELLAAAGLQLGLRGRVLSRLRAIGAQAAEAGAALAQALTAPQPTPEAPKPGRAAVIGDVQPDGSVRVAVAANQAETELLQGILDNAGIPSSCRRTGGDLPHLLGAGYREIYVPAAATDEAQALLATLDRGPAEHEPAPTRRVGLEHTRLRVFGKFTATLVALGLIASLAITLAVDEPALGLAAFVAILVVCAAVVLWSEHTGRT